ncbi:glycosyltransferase [bacterium]|nr:glycosyltransferase [bacterium]
MNVKTSPLVSVVVPHFNRHDLLPSLIQNVVAQTYRPIELLIVDDGSYVPVSLSDGVHEGVLLRVISLPHTGRPGLVRNAGIDLANGDLLAFLDSDDVWLPEKLSRQVSVFSNFPDIGLVHSNAYIIKGKERVNLLKRHCTGYAVKYSSLLKGNIVLTSSVMARKSLFETNKFSGLKSAQDYELWLKFADKFKFYYLEDPLFTYDHVCETRISKNGIRRYLCLLRVFRTICRISESKELKNIVLRRMAGFYFKLAKYSLLAHRELRCRKMLIKSLRILPTMRAAVALLMSYSRLAFKRKRVF